MKINYNNFISLSSPIYITLPLLPYNLTYFHSSLSSKYFSYSFLPTTVLSFFPYFPSAPFSSPVHHLTHSLLYQILVDFDSPPSHSFLPQYADPLKCALLVSKHSYFLFLSNWTEGAKCFSSIHQVTSSFHAYI
jgi:hypothetical protein